MITLPISVKAQMRGYLLYFYPCAILGAYEVGRQWYQQNYALPFSYINEDNDVNMEYIDGISYGKFYTKNNILYMKFHGQTDDIVSHIVWAIEHETYIIVFIDEFFRIESEQYKKEHFLHEILIYAYDEDNDAFTYLAFDNSMRLKSMRLSSGNLKEAYESGLTIDSTRAADWVYKRRIIDCRINKEFEIQATCCADKIHNYKAGGIQEIDASYKSNGRYLAYNGVDSTVLFLKIIQDDKEFYKKRIPYAGIHTLYETKVQFSKQLLRSELHAKLVSRYQENVVSYFNTARLLYLRSSYKNISSDAGKIYDAIMNGYENELSFLKEC